MTSTVWQWEHYVKMRNDDKVFRDFVSGYQKRPFPYLIKGRPIEDIKHDYDNLSQLMSITALTVTLKPELQLMEEPTVRRLIETFLLTLDIQNFMLFPDVDNSGNLHYHGVINIKQRQRREFKRQFNLNIGFIKFEYLSDPEGWYAYMRKDKGFTSREHPLPLSAPIYSDNELSQNYIYEHNTACPHDH